MIRAGIRYQYNPKTRMYEEEGDAVFEDYEKAEPVKKSLEDTGTRFDHLNDLIDYLSDGLVAVTASLDRYKNETDSERKSKLEAALALLRVYQEQMAGYAGNKHSFHKMLDDCSPSKETLTQIREEQAKKLKPESQKLLGDGDDTEGA